MVASTASTESGVLIIDTLNGNTTYLVYTSGKMVLGSTEVTPGDTLLHFSPQFRMCVGGSQSIDAPTLWVWNGYAVRNDNMIMKLPNGKYKMQFFGRKHFLTAPAALPNSNSMDIIATPTFNLV
jgi:hypothetical protein